MDGFEGGFALSFLGFFIALVGVIVMVFYRSLAGVLDRILRAGIACSLDIYASIVAELH
jgi:hypothetical protein